MHKIALEPKELYKLWGDGSSAGVEEVNLKRRSNGAVCQLVGGS
jgi:hypothetical protein